MNGRGTYVCYNKECAEIAIKKKKIEYAFDVSLNKDELDQLQRDILQTIEEVSEGGNNVPPVN
jgi:predicted RNA-binding protein YlxR (DUF448 family)